MKERTWSCRSHRGIGHRSDALQGRPLAGERGTLTALLAQLEHADRPIAPVLEEKGHEPAPIRAITSDSYDGAQPIRIAEWGLATKLGGHALQCSVHQGDGILRRGSGERLRCRCGLEESDHGRRMGGSECEPASAPLP